MKTFLWDALRKAVSASTSESPAPEREQKLPNHDLVARRLPPDFDPEAYLVLNPDVGEAGYEPRFHYLGWGQREKRLYAFPEIVSDGNSDFDPAKNTILLVSHDASRTGAPILALNLAQAFSDRYNIVAILLGDGTLAGHFRRACAKVVVQPEAKGNPAIAERLVNWACDLHGPRFALVNSIESRLVLPGLAKRFVPTIALLHEFASYTRPPDAFAEALLWSTRSVFSTDLTRQNAIAGYEGINVPSVALLSQGKCVVPGQSDAEDFAREGTAERARLTDLIRPSGKSTPLFVVLGAGLVQYRKGVDLFIECAARFMSGSDKRNFRFVWIGDGYEPTVDVDYSAYLADQIKRAGLDDHVVFTGETSEIEFAYQLGDVLLLPSRLDPMPHVAIEAMFHGLPVLCFDKTTGIAEFLAGNGLAESCVAPYMDTAALATKLLALEEAPKACKEIGLHCRAAATHFYDMSRYTDSLQDMADAVVLEAITERADNEKIRVSGKFDAVHASPRSEATMTTEHAIRRYVRSWRSGVLRRKPCPGFHPGIYQALNPRDSVKYDPFVDYLERGQPPGPWAVRLIGPQDMAKPIRQPTTLRVALHLHAYYPELLPAIVDRIEGNILRPDLFVSVPDGAARQTVKQMLSGYAGRLVDVRVVPNRGRNIGALLTGFGPQLVYAYDLVGHLHTKKSVGLADRDLVETWNEFLLENLLGGTSGGRMADTIVQAMSRDSTLAIVYPDDPHAIGWTQNRDAAEALAGRLGIAELPDEFNFPMGAMFWMRTSLLQRYVALGLQWEDYPNEPLPGDGTMLHALERLFGLAFLQEGRGVALTHVPGVYR